MAGKREKLKENLKKSYHIGCQKDNSQVHFRKLFLNETRLRYYFISKIKINRVKFYGSVRLSDRLKVL